MSNDNASDVINERGYYERFPIFNACTYNTDWYRKPSLICPRPWMKRSNRFFLNFLCCLNFIYDEIIHDQFFCYWWPIIPCSQSLPTYAFTIQGVWKKVRNVFFAFVLLRKSFGIFLWVIWVFRTLPAQKVREN